MEHGSTTTMRHLHTRKGALDNRISFELRRPVPDFQTLQGLKRARLSLIHRIADLERPQSRVHLPVPVRII